MEAKENFGQRMARLKDERGTGTQPGPGRPKIADKYKRQIAATEAVFANSMAEEAERYVEELQPKEPERCPFHGGVLICRDKACAYESQRTAYNHRAASYVFDRVMGRPTSRSENTITVRLVQELTAAFVGAFVDVNDIPDAHSRREAFAGRLAAIGADYGGPTAA